MSTTLCAGRGAKFWPTWGPDDVRLYLKANGISKAAFARSMGVTSNTVRRWVTTGPVPGPVQACLNAWVAGARLERVLETPRPKNLIPEWSEFHHPTV